MKTTVLHFKPSGQYGTEVKGESHYQDHLEYLASFSDDNLIESVDLFLEDHNVDDSNAVAVTAEGDEVGYLSRADAVRYRQAIARLGHPRAIGQCHAKITGGFERDEGGTANYGIKLDFDIDNLTIERISYVGKDDSQKIAKETVPPVITPKPSKKQNKIPLIPMKGSGWLYFLFVLPFVLIINLYILLFVGGWLALKWSLGTPERRKVTFIIMGILLIMILASAILGQR